jgi:multidrug efflux pump subunit AcrB
MKLVDETGNSQWQKVAGTASESQPAEIPGRHFHLMILITGPAGVKQMLPLLKEAMPKALRINIFGDQSVFVKSAVEDVVREAVLAALLTGMLVLLFLGDWRSTAIISMTIPLAALFSVVVLSATGQTINSMTLGGWRWQ